MTKKLNSKPKGKTVVKGSKIKSERLKNKSNVENGRKGFEASMPTKIAKVAKNKATMLEALMLTFGNVSEACEKTMLSRASHYEWMNNDEDYKRAVEAVDESNIDFAESKLRELIKGPEYEALSHSGKVVTLKSSPVPQAVMFFLKTKGKKRGYIEKTEVDVTVNAMENITFIIKGKDKD